MLGVFLVGFKLSKRFRVAEFTFYLMGFVRLGSAAFGLSPLFDC